MTPHYSKLHKNYTLNGIHFKREELLEVARNFVKDGNDFEREIGIFLVDWLC